MQSFTSASLDARQQCFNLRHQTFADHDLSSPSIQRLRIGPTSLTRERIQMLPPRLEYLDWDLGEEESVDASALCAVLQLPHLRQLSFRFRNEGIVQTLRDCLPYATALEALDLRSNLIGDDGIDLLADGLLQARLSSLNLGFNLITDRGAETLSRLVEHDDCTLTHLDLNCNLIGDTGGSAFARAMHKNSTLRSLILYGNARLSCGHLWTQLLEQNDALCTCNLERTQITDLSLVNYWLMLNKKGRKILKVDKLHSGVWPQFLEGQDQQDGLFFYFSQKPELFASRKSLERE